MASKITIFIWPTKAGDEKAAAEKEARGGAAATITPARGEHNYNLDV